MQVKEISTNFGTTFIGIYLGCHQDIHALKDVYRIVPVPINKTAGVNFINYEPSLLQLRFFGDNNMVVNFKNSDIFTIFDVTGQQLEKFLKIVNSKEKSDDN